MRGGIMATVLLAILAACGGSEEATPEAVADTYADLVYTAYDDSVASATEMQSAIDAFWPTPPRTTWRRRNEPGWTPATTTAPLRRFASMTGRSTTLRADPRQIQRMADGRGVHRLRGRRSRRRDHQPGAAVSCDRSRRPRSANQGGGEANSQPAGTPSSSCSGGRTSTRPDPARARTPTTSSAPAPTQRDAEYLRLATDLLVEHLQRVPAAWATEPGPTERRSKRGDPDQGLRRILAGMLILSGFELTGERLAVPYETRDQEDEHSCFSDTTHPTWLPTTWGSSECYLGCWQDRCGPGIAISPVPSIRRWPRSSRSGSRRRWRRCALSRAVRSGGPGAMTPLGERLCSPPSKRWRRRLVARVVERRAGIQDRDRAWRGKIGCAASWPLPCCWRGYRVAGGDAGAPRRRRPTIPDETRPGGPATVWDAGLDAFAFPASVVDRLERRAFAVGNAFFKENWVTAPSSTEGRDGLGPLFIARSCSYVPPPRRSRPPATGHRPGVERHSCRVCVPIGSER